MKRQQAPTLDDVTGKPKDKMSLGKSCGHDVPAPDCQGLEAGGAGCVGGTVGSYCGWSSVPLGAGDIRYEK